MNQKAETAFNLLKSVLMEKEFVNSGDPFLHGGEWRYQEPYRIVDVTLQKGAKVTIVGEYSDGRKSWYSLNVLRADKPHSSQIVNTTNTLILEDLLNLSLKGRRFIFPESGDRSNDFFQVDRKGQIYVVSGVRCDCFGMNRTYAEFENNGTGSFDLSKMLFDLAV